ncbi:arsenite efflux ATP-binding protein ArsA (TC 3.A.4.1.1) [Sulfobacillus acidophilus TPY]|nr:arsenite efflux ATP-binding protein ArsA (TC 3.A.4.1.1) [Sulfobacillus acidophilus TPY]
MVMPTLFFSGKGGVGKTSLAAATAVYLADRGYQTLLVTTDPASNLADVFQQPIGPVPVPIVAVPRLTAQEIDAEAAAEAYRMRALAPLQGKLPDTVLETLAEQMSGPCTVDIAGFDQFVQSLLEPAFDWLIFDTAPTGHTLRLLALPAAWSTHIELSSQGSGQTCLGPVDQLTTSAEQYQQAMARLKDPAETTFMLVAQPEHTSVDETLRAANELRDIGLTNLRLIINGVIPEESAHMPFLQARRDQQQLAIARLRQVFGYGPEVPLQPGEITGVDRLRSLGRWVTDYVPA